MVQVGWHFSCGRGFTRGDQGEAAPFSVERLKMDVLCVQSAGPPSADGAVTTHQSASAQADVTNARLFRMPMALPCLGPRGELGRVISVSTLRQFSLDYVQGNKRGTVPTR